MTPATGDARNGTQPRGTGPPPRLCLNKAQLWAVNNLPSRGSAALAAVLQAQRPLHVLCVGGSNTRGRQVTKTFFQWLQDWFAAASPAIRHTFDVQACGGCGTAFFVHCLDAYLHRPTDVVLLETAQTDWDPHRQRSLQQRQLVAQLLHRFHVPAIVWVVHATPVSVANAIVNRILYADAARAHGQTVVDALPLLRHPAFSWTVGPKPRPPWATANRSTPLLVDDYHHNEYGHMVIGAALSAVFDAALHSRAADPSAAGARATAPGLPDSMSCRVGPTLKALARGLKGSGWAWRLEGDVRWPKPGFVSHRPGSRLTLGPVELPPEGRVLALGYLASYGGYGTFEISSSTCRLEPCLHTAANHSEQVFPFPQVSSCAVPQPLALIVADPDPSSGGRLGWSHGRYGTALNPLAAHGSP